MNVRVPVPIATVALAVATALLGACTGSTAERPRPTAACPSQIVPAYQRAWSTTKQILEDPGRVRAVVLGEGGITPRMKRQAIERLHESGVKVLAYAFTRRPGPYDETTFGARPLRDVKAQIRAARDAYDFDGAFVDNLSRDPGKLPYYAEIARFVRSDGGLVVFNGLGSPQLVPLADVLVEFEGYYRDFVGFEPPPWVQRFPAAKFAEIVHDVPLGKGPAVAAVARRTNAGNVFFTDSGFPHPYGRMPLLKPPACG